MPSFSFEPSALSSTAHRRESIARKSASRLTPAICTSTVVDILTHYKLPQHQRRRRTERAARVLVERVVCTNKARRTLALMRPQTPPSTVYCLPSAVLSLVSKKTVTLGRLRNGKLFVCTR